MLDKIVGSIGQFSYKNRKAISLLAVILFVCVIILESFTVIEYSYAEDSLVTDIFPQDDTVVIVYGNGDEDKMESVIEYLEGDEHITSVQAYANTLGMKLTASEMAEMAGIDEVFVNTLFYVYENGWNTTGMTLYDFVSFISSDAFLENELFASMMNEEYLSLIDQMKGIVLGVGSGEKYGADEIASMLDVDKQLVQSIFYVAQIKNANIFTITPAFWSMVADTLGMDADTIERVFKVRPVKELALSEFIDITCEVAQYAEVIIGAEQLAQLETLKAMSDEIQSGATLTPADLSEMLASVEGANDLLNEDTLTLLYIMARGNTTDTAQSAVPLYDFFTFLCEDIVENESFSGFLDADMKAQLSQAKVTMEEGRAQLVGAEHSRMVITLDYPLESEGINTFYVDFTEMLDSTLDGKYYLVGNSAMSYEVGQSFETEYLIISIVTAIAVFLVVLFTFKNVVVSALLIAVIECAVFAMMSVMAIICEPMYFVALILVQCILMGSMIDYAILFTTYYKEVRREYSVEEALPEVMRRATHAILTSSLVIVFVTLICGRIMSGTVAVILSTLGIGALCAILLILFVLPSLLVIFDKHVIKEPKNKREGIE